MAKFMMECPNCGRYAEANSGILGFFATKKINCSCGHIIDVKTEKVAARKCVHCGNEVIFDQSKGEQALCPVCHEKINTSAYLNNLVKFSCPSCSCELTADKNAEYYTCPLCETQIDVQKQVSKEAVSNKGLASVIKYEGDRDSLVWKHPIEDFNLGSQLIVHESQEAIFFRDGRALDLFGSGRYTLTTQQLPILEELYKLPSNLDRTFHSEVYFINKVAQMAFKWGTPDKITYIEPTSGAAISIGARGMFNFRVSDSRKILLKLVGTTQGIDRFETFDAKGSQSYIRDYFRSAVQVSVTSKLADILAENDVDILQIDRQKAELSKVLKQVIAPYFDDYGITVTECVLEGILLPEKGELGYDVVQTLIKLRQVTLEKSVISTRKDIKFAEMEAQKDISIRTEQNKAEIESARRGTVEQKGMTEILEAQLAGQKKLAQTQADVAAEKLRLEIEMQRKAQTAQIEAEEMRAKGYSQKDVIQGEVLKSFAENQPSGGGAGSISGMAGTAMQAGTQFATMGAMAGIAANMMGTGVQIGKDMTGALSSQMGGMYSKTETTAPGGFDLNNISGFSTSAQSEKTSHNDGWTCTACGTTRITSKFCPECGAKAPEKPIFWNCPNCGVQNITSKFCPDCGMKKPESATWNCKCGAKDITSKFCPECGSKRGE